MKHFTTDKQKLGLLGENIVTRFYKNKGYTILARNWPSMGGELDLVVSREPVCSSKKALHEKHHELVFVEIKTVSCENLGNTFRSETKINPVEQFHVKKQERMLKTISDYLIENSVPHETLWRVDLVCVYVNLKNMKYKLDVFKNCPLN